MPVEFRSLPLLALAAFSPPAAAQCPGWVEGFGFAGPTDTVHALEVLDLGDGPALYVGGDFSEAGDAVARYVARWDGGTWTALAQGAPQQVRALAAHDDGNGLALYAGGIATLARWDGSSWLELADVTGTVRCLAVYDDGAGPKLYAGGGFTLPGVPGSVHLARWDGSSVTPLSVDSHDVLAMVAHDDGGGPALFVARGGSVERFDGTSWLPAGTGAPAATELVVHDEGQGPVLIAGGDFPTAGGVLAKHVARWDGTSWSALGNGLDKPARDLWSGDDGSGPALFAAEGSPATGGHRVSRWDGSAWTPIAPGLDDLVHAVATFDGGSGPALFAGGQSEIDGSFLARREAGAWGPVPGGPGGVDGGVAALARHEVGGAPVLAVGGSFTTAGHGQPANGLALFDGTSWSALGAGLGGQVQALASCDVGSGRTLFAATDVFGSQDVTTAAWDGAEWVPLGTPPDGSVQALAAFDDGSGTKLVAGGTFQNAGGAPARHVAAWDGASWAALGAGPEHHVEALLVFDDGSGPKLHAAGRAPDTSLGRLSRFDGATWTLIGSFGGSVACLAAFDDGSGPALYAGGQFATVDGAPIARIARWDGATWSAVGGGTNGVVWALFAFDDGGGAALYAGGTFSSAGGVPAHGLARWNGAVWTALTPDLGALTGNAGIAAFAAFDVPGGPAPRLVVGGTFGRFGWEVSRNVAMWRACSVGEVLCLGDGTGAPCPCGNEGLPGHGCRNSASIRGAELAASGFASTGDDGLALACAFEPPGVTSVVLQGSQLVAPVVFGDGLRCAGGALKRLYVQNADAGGNLLAPPPGAPSIAARSAALGDPLQAGESRVYQVYYRDPVLEFCPAPAGSSFNASNGVRVLWLP